MDELIAQLNHSHPILNILAEMIRLMNKWIVITTINKPSSTIHRVSEMVASDGWRCVVIGDKKTPENWGARGIDYLSFHDQMSRYGELALQIPANHYSRKNLGYIYAIENGAEVILETDDDNIPLKTFGEDINRIVFGDFVSKAEWANVYKYFTDSLIWPRGNPLDTLHSTGTILGKTKSIAPIQQYLANGDPDVDAIYRFLYKDPTTFITRDPVILDRGTWCSFNSQNTLFFKEAFPLLYLPCHVSFRMTDIWRSLVAQIGLWSQGHHLAFKSATVIQERNAHDLMKDFNEEVVGYLNNSCIASSLVTLLDSLPETSLSNIVRASWSRLNEMGIIADVELDIYDSWTRKCGDIL